MHAAIRQTKLKPGTGEEVLKKANEGAVPLITSQPGFKSYYLVLSDDDTITTVSIFADKAAAQACNAKLVDWIKQNIGPHLDGAPKAMDGRVAISKP